MTLRMRIHDVKHVKMASRSKFQIKMKHFLFVFLVILTVAEYVSSLPEAGKKHIVLTNKNTFGIFKKIAFKDSDVKMHGVSCKSKEPEEIRINWRLKFSSCAENFLNVKPSVAAFYMQTEGEFAGKPGTISCNKFPKLSILDISKFDGNFISRKKTVNTTDVPGNTTSIVPGHRRRPKRSKESLPAADPAKASKEVKLIPKTKSHLKTVTSGAYMLVIHANTVNSEGDFELEIDVEIGSKKGYLSATEWPLLPFFGVMSLVYLSYAIGWFSASCCNWRDLLRIQFWIGGVIALGMLEKALFYSEYQNVNHTGEESNGLVIFAELVSCMKRTLARILVIIVSMGFGIVKPRLGSALPKILACGLLFFILASVEGCFRALSPKAAPSRQQMIAAIPLVVLDSVICWWVFTALVQTTRTLRIRKNLVKLSLYRHFTNTLIFAVISSIIYMVWSIKSHSFADCTDFTEVWLDDAFWPFLFSLILLVIMILWRPTNNNQRYAFTPLMDISDEEDEFTMSEAFDGMKLRNQRKDSNGHLKNRNADDDLKWVEENIPSIPTSVLPSLDSDEEIMTTRLEMSKME